jgi:hypothetical protein
MVVDEVIECEKFQKLLWPTDGKATNGFIVLQKNYHGCENFYTTKTQSPQRKNNWTFFVPFVPLWSNLVATEAALRNV